MSLVGNLEDLGLGEILQIVSLSRKSGVLELKSLDREGRVVFRDGEVIRATASTLPENLGDLLLRRDAIDYETMKQALRIQQQEGGHRRFGEVLVDDFGFDKDLIETLVRQQVERIVYSFFAWNEGSFAFELGEPKELAVTSLNPLNFILDNGLNPQWLAMEGSRLLDEKRHAGEDLEERGESVVDVERLMADALGQEPKEASPSTKAIPPQDRDETKAQPPATSSETGRPVIYLVDDDPGIVERMAVLLQAHRIPMRAFTNGNSFFQALAEADSSTTLLVIDLIMPRQDGSGLLGGLELLQNVRRDYPDFQVLVMSDHPNQEAEESVREFSVPALLPKPKNTEILTAQGEQTLAALVDVLLTVGKREGEPPSEPDQLFNIGAELMREMGESEIAADSSATQQSPGLHLLRGMLQELSNPSLGGGIILLILRFASELMNRAVIFLVKEKEIVGLGQFGIELEKAVPDLRVRDMSIPVAEPNLFSTVLETRGPQTCPPPAGQWNDYLFDQLGGERPAEVFIGPLLSEGRVVAVLYGDNLPEQKPIGDTEALEIFLSQAGLAMEKALLERRLMSGQAVG